MSTETPIGIALIDSLTGQFYSVNSTFAEIMGRTEGALIRFNWMNMTHPDDLQAELSNMALMNAGKISGFQLEKRFRHRDGTFVWIDMTVAPIFVNDKAHPRHLCMIEDITSRKHVEVAALTPDCYDTLTALPNRNLLMNYLNEALTASAHSHHYGAVLLLDLDRLSVLNERLGHDYGDQLLIEVAKRIQSCVNGSNTVARLQGDEFVVLFQELGKPVEVAMQIIASRAEKIRASLFEPYQLKEQIIHSTPSIGLILFKGADETADGLLKQAEMAMYQAKGLGGNCVQIYEPAKHLEVASRPMLEAYLRRAIPSKELQLYYQMQMDSNHNPLGAEVLIRWNHPTRGLIFPAQFIPIAEDSALIFDIDNWVLNAACRQLEIWARYELTQDLTLSVNISVQQFKQPDFVENIATALQIYGFTASNLKLELAEQVMLNNLAGVLDKMHALKALGVGLSIDNFGIGNSPLASLQQLPLDQIKIAPTFVRDLTTDPNEAFMVQTIIDMSKKLRMDVIAAGVETEAQLASLKEYGCMAFQGYFFNKPMPINQFEALLN
jgi:diguanylate cyclase (GGDEF)-like protein/PAS domain S-box-containing protein